MESPWPRDRDRGHGSPKGAALTYPSTIQPRGIRMFGEERSYFRYVVVGLLGLMMVGFWMLSKPA
jgi:hypothetical protein